MSVKNYWKKISILIICLPLSFLTGPWFLRFELEHSTPFSYWEGFESGKEDLYRSYRYPFALLLYGVFVGVSLTMLEYTALENTAPFLFIGYLCLIIGHVFSLLVIPLFLSLYVFLFIIGIKILAKQYTLIYLPILGIVVNLYFIPFQFMYFQDWWSVFGD